MWEIKSKYVQVISKADWWHSPCGELLCTCPLFEIVNSEAPVIVMLESFGGEAYHFTQRSMVLFTW